MYIFGIFQTIEQDTAFSAAIWDGQTLASLHFPFAFPNSYFAAITDAVSHNGKFMLGAILWLPQEEQIQLILRGMMEQTGIFQIKES
ncbi:MAG: hypothetical protein MK226_01030 [Saprospiraceae bacterium]|nr:hypothetical protein [Saprospiraceae bacterium]